MSHNMLWSVEIRIPNANVLNLGESELGKAFVKLCDEMSKLHDSSVRNETHGILMYEKYSDYEVVRAEVMTT